MGDISTCNSLRRVSNHLSQVCGQFIFIITFTKITHYIEEISHQPRANKEVQHNRALNHFYENLITFLNKNLLKKMEWKRRFIRVDNKVTRMTGLYIFGNMEVVNIKR